MKLSLAYSPCPNDTFAFHAMVHGLVDCEDLSFEVHLADVEELNKRARNNSYDICKLSYHAFFLLAHNYAMLRTGSALGFGNGPLLVSNNGKAPDSGSTVLIPGEKTTAALLLKIAFPHLTKTLPALFSDIEEELCSNRYQYGVLIHEKRFTYQSKGLSLIADLGEIWSNVSGMPVPLGGIAVSRSLESGLPQKIERVLKRSIEFALANPEVSQEYVCNYAQESDRNVQQKHVRMFVNEFTRELGNEGERAVKELYRYAAQYYPELIKTENLFIL